MYKIYTKFFCMPSGGIPKLLLIMKLTTFILIISLMQVSAATFGQRMTLKQSNITLEKVFREIIRQTGYDVLITDTKFQLSKKINVNFNKAPLSEVLDQLVQGTNLTYSIDDKSVKLKERKAYMTDPTISQQQYVDLNGKVIDENGKPIAGVSLLVNGKGASTDLEGRFLLRNIHDNDVIRVTSVGYESIDFQIIKNSSSYVLAALRKSQSELLSITYGARPSITIKLKQAISVLNETVVIGYGSQKKEDVTGSISSIDDKTLMQNTVGTASFDRALGGLAKGVFVSQSTGDPGASASINIRGFTSPFSGGSNQPLFVIDGVSFNLDAPFNTGGFTNSMPQANPLLSLDPNNIESIDILKDAAATAIYGSRGANGVIIVTTKKGKKGEKTQVDFSFTTSIGKPANQLKLMNTDQFKTYTDLIFKNTVDAVNKGQVSAGNLAPFIDGKMADIKKDLVTNKYVYNGLNPTYFGKENTNWVDEIYRDNALTHQANLNFRGSSNNTTYSLGGSYLDQNGTMINSSLKQYNFYTNLNMNLNKFITVGSSIRVGHTLNKSGRFGAGSEASSFVLTARPDLPVFNEQGGFMLQSNFDFGYEAFSPNPVAQLQYKMADKGYTLLGNAFAEVAVLKNLKIKADFNTGLFLTKGDFFSPTVTNGFYPGSPLQEATLQISDALNFNKVINLTANYLLALDKHHMEFVAGYAVDRTTVRRGFTYFSGFPDDEVLINANNAASVIDYGDGRIESGLNSIFGRALYNYDNRYLATVNFRSDASSKFGPDKKRGYFPSVSLGWNMNNEAFFKEQNLVEHLKLRGSLGRTGSSNIDDFSYFQFFEKGFRDNGIYNGLPAVLFSSTLPNADISWETTTEYNLGLDFGFKARRVYGSIDFYNRETKGALAPTPFPLELGPEVFTSNLVNMSNKGLELELGVDILRNKQGFNWSVAANWSFNRSKIKSLNGAVIPSYQLDSYIVGEPVGTIKGYKVAGIFQNQAEVDALNAAAATKYGAGTYYERKGTSVGDYKTIDVDGDGRITDADRAVIGSIEPDFFGGLTNTFAYKGFELTAFCQFVSGVEADWRNARMNGRSYPAKNNLVMYADNTWTPENPNAEFARVVYTDPGNNRKVTDRNIYDASYFKLKNLYMRYTFPTTISKKLMVSNLALFTSMSNVFTITKWPGTDPETVSGVNIPLRGTNTDPYPLTRNISFGLSVNF
ncbi:SusC/RagA family TonB-linked outer membrane protein [Sphingobacterium sp. SRCM116780]|uniref:SusC/RagA family TonB-linked outer membrane protein n=1 Tax=Sphingobacterium sp. SRCM116780 TaxID=2907623 RepID=UPI001F2467FC|nr:SusC/RagA family TonB-linked outer membrane protein [Sphingobacterium sp. SRCM116780]UIR55680.1 SusC/RagA family TonB-linked outer membrane protein [Sphingobacterium sp. SRCM116780]